MMKLNRSKQMQRFALLKPARYFWKPVEGLGGRRTFQATFQAMRRRQICSVMWAGTRS
jgi:hypothetical protein